MNVKLRYNLENFNIFMPRTYQQETSWHVVTFYIFSARTVNSKLQMFHIVVHEVETQSLNFSLTSKVRAAKITHNFDSLVCGSVTPTCKN